MQEGDLLGGRFLAQSLAGMGAMGQVWRALDRETGVAVAVKVLLPGSVDVARFVREADFLARLRDPNVVSYVAHGAEAGRHYLITEWLEGEDLAERLRRGVLGVEDAFRGHRARSEAWQRVNVGAGLALLGEYESGVRQLELATSEAENLATHGVLRYGQEYLANALRRLGRVDDAAELAAMVAVESLARGDRSIAGQAHCEVAWCLLAQDRLDETSAEAHRAVDAALRRLEGRADCLRAPERRASFLGRVEEHARLRALAGTRA